MGEVTQVNDSSTPEGVIVTQSPKRGPALVGRRWTYRQQRNGSGNS